ncbi:5'/3'-nucleotidase SurE [Chloroflexota bacterium]
MKILVTNDDGISAEGLWLLVRELKKIAQVVAVAPDREQSAIGTAVTLSRPLRVHKMRLGGPEVTAYAVEGTPADSVILALEKLVGSDIDLVISGINQGLNVGNDVLISGTVGAALQGYLRGFSAIAVSLSSGDSRYLKIAARVAALLAAKIKADAFPPGIFLNVNLPDLPLAGIKGLKVTRLASESHVDTVEEGHDGKREYYWLVRRRLDETTKNLENTVDIGAIEAGYISVTPLHIYLNGRHAPIITDSFCSDVFKKLREGSQ